jgi:SNF2 family DNA or RNA helicase
MREAVPQPGQVVRVRSRQYLVEEVVPPPAPAQQTLVRLSCLDDDAQGQPLEALWEKEVDAQVLSDDAWRGLGKKGFDEPRLFSAWLNTLRWNCVTSTDPRLFQSPWRAGIQVMTYQLEPLRKALLLPRVNLLIADDVGLGKTIEAGLIVRELLMRQKVRRIVVAAPPSVVLQWRDELEQRFGLTFVVFDREYVLEKRRERGFAANPWTTHTRFIMSHALLRDEAYAGPLRDWLGDFSAGSLLVLDEAHNAAPASGAKYAIDSMLTRAVRDIAQHFEHRLFLTATPHNGHSNSFAALLELLDPHRFCRGVPVKGPKLLDKVMVRRLKKDLREVTEGFPDRQVVQVDIDGLPQDAPELSLARLLDEYAKLRAERLKDETKTRQAAAALITVSLQKRLLSSIEAFARTLAVHRRAVAKAEASKPHEPRETADVESRFGLLRSAPGGDDERAGLSETEVEQEEEAQMEAASKAAQGREHAGATSREREILDEMTRIAEAARHKPDPRILKLVDWLRDNLCPGLPPIGSGQRPTPAPAWNPRRVLIFTEYTDTKRYLEQQLKAAIASSDRAADRVRTFHGGMGEDTREEIKRAFNADPAKHPLRILIATDAAREGVNLQNHCADLFHFEVPWNPGRMEQRNGRIDRKLQRAPVVRCHYFFHRQRPQDRVLQALVRKSDTIAKELGSLTPVVERRLERLLQGGISGDQADQVVKAIDAEEVGGEDKATVDEELEAARERQEELQKQLERLRTISADSQKLIGFDKTAFRDALSESLRLLGAEPLKPANGQERSGHARWVFPALDQRAGADSSWADTLDTLRPPRQRDQKPWEWRKDAKPRPVVFEDSGSLDDDTVHLHLEHRVVQRLLGRFLAQGFVHDDLSRACLGQTQDAIPRVLALGRLSLYGEGAARLHDEVLIVAARWTEPSVRKESLKPFGREGELTAEGLLKESLVGARPDGVPERMQEKLLASIGRDMEELLPHLRERADGLAEKAKEKLRERGEKEAADMAGILQQQRERIEKRAAQFETKQLELEFDADERRQIEADKKHWQRRLAQLGEELQREPERIRAAYQVKATRIEPLGIVYLWPTSG